MSSIRSISEQVSLLYSRDKDRYNHQTSLSWREAKHLVVQAANEIMGLKTVNLAERGIDPNIVAAMTAVYRRRPVLKRTVNGSDQYYIQLPAIPLSLPMDAGLYSIRPSNSLTGSIFILPTSMFDIINELGDEEVNNTCYAVPQEKEAFFTKDPGASQVDVTLVVLNADKFGDTDLLPVNPEIEMEIIRRSLSLLTPERNKDTDPEIKKDTDPEIKKDEYTG
jgi:hypothetical protein